MREHGLVGRASRRRRVVTTDSTHEQPIAPNLLARQFDVTGVGGVNRVWVSDITYIPTHEGWLYLAVVLDLASRRVVGWAMRETLQAELALSALQMAVMRSPASPRPGPSFRSGDSVRVSRVSGTAHGARLPGQHEPTRQLLG
jgi:transposase InsO family protein